MSTAPRRYCADTASDRYPLGEPINRPAPKGLTPVPGRPNWWADAHGVERYIEPVRPFVWPLLEIR